MWTVTLAEVFFLGRDFPMVTTFLCFLSFVCFSYFYEQWTHRWPMTIPDNKVYLPTESFPHLSIHRICLNMHFSYIYWSQKVLLRHIMKLERHLHIGRIGVFPTCFHWQKMWGKDHSRHYHSHCPHQVNLPGKFLNLLRAHVWQQALPCLHSHLLETLMFNEVLVVPEGIPQKLH